MASIFNKQADITQHPNRNKFDYSKNVYGTYKAGYLYPNLVMRAVPTDQFRIKTDYFMNFMPTAYPLQSRMRVIQHFFEVPIRLLWDDYENWSMGLDKEAVPPYIDQPAEKFFTGGLYDHLGVPTTIMSDVPVAVPLEVHKGLSQGVTSAKDNIIYQFPEDGMLQLGVACPTVDIMMNSTTGMVVDSEDKYYEFANAIISESRKGNDVIRFNATGNGWTLSDSVTARTHYIAGMAINMSGLRITGTEEQVEFKSVPNQDGLVEKWNTRTVSHARIAMFCSDAEGASINKCRLRYVGGDGVYSGESSAGAKNYSKINKWYSKDVQTIDSIMEEYQNGTVYVVLLWRLTGQNNQDLIPPARYSVGVDMSEPREFSTVPGANPYYSSSNTSADTVRLSALIPRAYEFVYNAFYRNKTGAQPFVVDGKTKYNDWLPTHAGGADTTDYVLHQRNWELDAFTSCLPSPQLGDAPLVGITALGDITVVQDDGTVTKIGTAVDSGGTIQVVDSNPQNDVQARALVSLASSGISIADFRQTNALQTFLEQTLRSGLTYFDFIRGHFGKGPSKAELQMPRFLGGTSTELQVNMISNTTASEEVPLGAYAGQANAFGRSEHSVHVYCDDFSIILGIMCIVPDPAYSQLLPKYWKLDDPLDLYYPEFGELGMQPITYEELAPIQSKLSSMFDSNKKLTDVFGYQRPNHDLVWQPDSLHGEFRKTLNRYLVNRRFGSRPELGNEFMVIDPAEVNRSFVVTTAEAGSGDDIAIGQTRHNIVAKRPVRKVVVPSLGR